VTLVAGPALSRIALLGRNFTDGEALLAGLADEVRAFVAASLEDELEWEREVREARQAPRAYMQPTWFFFWDARERYPYGWWCP